jgi:hypothetical protein
MRTTTGIQFDVVAVDATHKAQEWLIPWGALGLDAPAQAGQRLGFSGGFNDKDGDSPETAELRWMLKDPWVGLGEANYWGDLEVASSATFSGCSGAIHPHHAMSAASAVVGHATTYALDGRISGIPAGSAAVRVVRKTDGGRVMALIQGQTQR